MRKAGIATFGRKFVLTIILTGLIAISSLFLVSSLHAHAVQISRQGNSVALIYKRLRGTTPRVEQSADLVHWTLANSNDVLLGKQEGVETIKSTVTTGSSKRLFFRVPVTIYWNVTLAWDPSSDPNVAGYRIYYGPASGGYTEMVDVGNQTLASVSLPQDGRPYFFVVTAYTFAGLESVPSAEIACAGKS